MAFTLTRRSQQLSLLQPLCCAALLLAPLVAASGCNRGETESTVQQATRLPSDRPDDQGRCEANGAQYEVSEYDTSGDDIPDVRKVFLTVGSGRLARLVLVCREADLNGDGVKDVVRFYTDEGRPRTEESDRDFDGRMDQVTYFEHGRVARLEQDSTGDGRVDTKIFYEAGVAVRTERDLAGRSTAETWQPDRWEYFEDGRLVRMGTDIDGDGRVDVWDRDDSRRGA
jgi:hypothetical protein